MRPVFPLLASIAAILASCGRPPAAPQARETREPIVVAAASDLQAVFPTLAQAFERRTGLSVTPTFGASGRLAEQVRQGASIDVFLSANRAFVEKLAEEGLVEPDSVVPYAIGKVVLAVHERSAGTVKNLADLAKPEIEHIAIANPDLAPYGAAAREALQMAGLWERLQPKIVLAENIRQAQQYVVSGDAQAGLISGSSARDTASLKTAPVDPSLHDPIVQCLGVVRSSKQPEVARAFASFITGDEARSLLSDAGFLLPEPSEQHPTGPERPKTR